jgi:hypothetical protein
VVASGVRENSVLERTAKLSGGSWAPPPSVALKLDALITCKKSPPICVADIEASRRRQI